MSEDEEVGILPSDSACRGRRIGNSNGVAGERVECTHWLPANFLPFSPRSLAVVGDMMLSEGET